MAIESEEEYSYFGALFKIQSSINNWINYCCVLYYDEQSSPEIIIRSTKEYTAWILFDKTVALVDFEKLNIIKKVPLPMCYWTAFCSNNNLVVIHEFGASCFDIEANEMWEISGKDKLNDFKINENQLICIFDDGERKAHLLTK